MELLAAALVLSGIAFKNAWLLFAGLALLFLLIGSALEHAAGRRAGAPRVSRARENPILSPEPSHSWESAAVFNPGALYYGGRVHLLYRALGADGLSRIGYAESLDGIHFTRHDEPVFVPKLPAPPRRQFANPFASKAYDRDLHASGGGWGGSEDPRAIEIDDTVYMTFGMFESWQSMRMAVTSISGEHFMGKLWRWMPHALISPTEETNKNWVLFPEKINGKFAILHALTPEILIDYAESVEEWEKRPIKSNNKRGGRPGHWDAFVRGAAAPPVKTPRGWLLFYHGMDPAEPDVGYKVGAMLLDLENPTNVLYRSETPVLVPTEWYEHDWKPNVVYASGAVVKDGTLFLYYGGGDKTINVATAPLATFLDELTAGSHTSLAPAAI